MFSDSKGFLWLGHSLGVSRYDGKKFIPFTSNEQTNLGYTDLSEDKTGRIWCHNFAGQIFYIENERMILLKQYDFKNEPTFPIIRLYKDEMLATSKFGLFSCNIHTLACKYISDSTYKSNYRSICIYKEQAIIFNGLNFYTYKNSSFLKKIPFSNKFLKSFSFNPNLSLAALNTNDSFYAYNNSIGKLYIFKEKNDTIFVLKELNTKGYINTVRLFKNKIWVHTKQMSYPLFGNEQPIKKYNLTDITTDKFGNTWYGSLQSGIMIQKAGESWETHNLSFIPNGDFIRCLIKKDSTIIYGTQQGKIIVYATNQRKVVVSWKLPDNLGSAENIFSLPNGRLLIAPSIGLFIGNIISKQLFQISLEGTVKTYTYSDSFIFLGYATKFIKIRLDNSLKNYFSTKYLVLPDEINWFTYLKEKINISSQIVRQARTYFASYDSISHSTYISFKDGLFKLIGENPQKITFNGMSLNAQNIIQYKNKMLVNTINKGLFIYNSKGEINISTDNGLISNTIIQMKQFGNNLYLYEPDNIQVFNLETEKIIQSIPLPEDIDGSIYDLLVSENILFITSRKNVYSISIFLKKNTPNSIYLLSARSELKDAEIENNTSLSYDNNSILFYIGYPVYNVISKEQIQYRLTGNFDTTWKTVGSGVNLLKFYALRPGKYNFECYATYANKQSSTNIIHFSFRIEEQWWKQLWFITLTILFAMAILIYAGKRYVNQLKLKSIRQLEKIELEKKLVSGTLAAIRAQMNPHFIFNALNTLQSLVYKEDKRIMSNYLGKFSDLLRNILDNSQKEFITLTEEIRLLKLYTDIEIKRFGEEISINYELDPEIDTEQVLIPPMLIQPYVENAFKHGIFHKQGDKFLSIIIKKLIDNNITSVLIKIEDNGIGRVKSNAINQQRPGQKSFSIIANETRIDLINKVGKHKIKVSIIDKHDSTGSATGTIVEFNIPYKSND
jgi:sensor histidine kinase YesM